MSNNNKSHDQDGWLLLQELVEHATERLYSEATAANRLATSRAALDAALGAMSRDLPALEERHARWCRRRRAEHEARDPSFVNSIPSFEDLADHCTYWGRP